MKKYIILLIFIFLFNCGKWKTTKLKSDLLCTISPGESTGSVILKYDEDDILNISFRIWVYNNHIYIADNILKRMQILNKKCEPVTFIGDTKPGLNEKTGVKYSKFQFSNINTLAVDSNGNIYIQNSFSSSGKNIAEPQGLLPSYILVFDDKGTLLYTLGKSGSPDIPFNSIESMEIDNNDRLYITTRTYDMWSVYRFENKRRDQNINFSENDFKENDGDDIYIGKIEKIIPFKSSDNLLIAVAYYSGADFKHRKIYNYSLRKEKIIHSAFVISDPKNELFALVDDKYIYLWDIDDQNLRYMICNLNGDVSNNISIKFSTMPDSYNEIQIDNSGHFYSYHALKKGVEVLEWR
jgi:hypothetical protein